LQNFSASNLIMQGVVLLLALGFPVSLLLAWVYDITPQGVAVIPRKDESHTAPARQKPGMVVVRLDAFSVEPADEVLGDRFTDDLSASMEHLTGVRVVSRTGSHADGERVRDVRETAPEPGVSYRLVGNLHRMGEVVRVTAQLVRADDGAHLWANNYDTNIDDLRQVQNELLRDVALHLGVEPAPPE
jgi:TolB-like protein